MEKDADYYRKLSLSYQPCNRTRGQPRNSLNKKAKPKVHSEIMDHFAKGLFRRRTTSERTLSVILAEVLPRHNLQFSEQVVIGPYIVDFLIEAKKLVIEVDGLTHFYRDAKDRHRTQKIRERGYRVIRFMNHDIKTDPVKVIKRILLECGEDSQLGYE